MLQKYAAISRSVFFDTLAYPASFLIWRLRMFILFFITLSLWTGLFSAHTTAFGYTTTTILTFVFVSHFLSTIIFSTRAVSLADEIWNGELSNLLVRPVRVFRYWFARDIADKGHNILFTSIEAFILFLLFRPALILPSSPAIWLYTLLFVVGGVGLYFFICLLLGFLGFWSGETWGPRFLFYTLLQFASGQFIPLDVYPKVAQDILRLTPFPYFAYIPAQVFLGRFDASQLFHLSVNLGIWLVLVAGLVQIIWKKGLYHYESNGR